MADEKSVAAAKAALATQLGVDDASIEESKANALGTARSIAKGATLGISDTILAKASALIQGQEQADALMAQQRSFEQGNPGTAALGEMAGSAINPIAGIIGEATTGARLAVKAGAQAAGAIASTGARRAADWLSDVDLDDDPKTVASAWNALTSDPWEYIVSGLTGAAAPAVSAGVRKAGKAIVGAVDTKVAQEGEALFGRVAAEKAIAKSGLSKAQVEAKVVSEGILKDYEKATELKEAAGKKMGDIAAKIDPKAIDHDTVGIKLLDVVEQAQQGVNRLDTATVTSAVKDIEHALTVGRSPAELQSRASAWLQEGRAASSSQAKALYNSLAHGLYDELDNAANMTHKDLGNAYKAARTEFKQYINIEKMLSGAKPQDDGNLAIEAAKFGIKKVLPGGAAYGALERLAGNPPTNKYLKYKELSGIMKEGWINTLGNGIDSLVSKAFDAKFAPEIAAKVSGHEYHKNTSELLRQIEADPEGYSTRLHDKLVQVGMGTKMADALVVKTMGHLGAVSKMMPQPALYGTIFDDAHTDPEEKKLISFQRTFMAHFQPLDALRTGDPLAIKMVREAHPEIAQMLDEKVQEKLQSVDKAKVPYAARRQVGILSGTAGVPSQNPLQAAQVQAIHGGAKARKQQGQQNSARVVKAVKNRDASVAATRSNQIINPGMFK